MSDYSALKATINANVKANNNQEITGTIMNSVLNAMVNSLGAGYQFIGVATPTNPGTAQTPDYKCFYLATTPGTYTYLGGLVVADGEVALLKWDTAWQKEVTGIASADKLNQLGQEIGGKEKLIFPSAATTVPYKTIAGHTYIVVNIGNVGAVISTANQADGSDRDREHSLETTAHRTSEWTIVNEGKYIFSGAATSFIIVDKESINYVLGKKIGSIVPLIGMYSSLAQLPSDIVMGDMLFLDSVKKICTIEENNSYLYEEPSEDDLYLVYGILHQWDGTNLIPIGAELKIVNLSILSGDTGTLGVGQFGWNTTLQKLYYKITPTESITISVDDGALYVYEKEIYIKDSNNILVPITQPYLGTISVWGIFGATAHAIAAGIPSGQKYINTGVMKLVTINNNQDPTDVVREDLIENIRYSLYNGSRTRYFFYKDGGIYEDNKKVPYTNKEVSAASLNNKIQPFISVEDEPIAPTDITIDVDFSDRSTLMNEVYSLFDGLVQEYPAIVESHDAATVAGVTYPEGWEYPINLYTIKSTRQIHANKKRILLFGGEHGNEAAAIYNTYLFAKFLLEEKDKNYQNILYNFDVWIIPVLCGYGCTHGSRTNENGVNINRNYPRYTFQVSGEGTADYTGPSGGSELETQVIVGLINRYTFDLVIDHHNYSGVRQFYGEAVDDLQPLLEQALYDVSYGIKTEYPQYFKGNQNLFTALLWPGNNYDCKSFLYLDDRGITSVICEISDTINYLNGNVVQGFNQFSSEVFSVGQFTLLRVIARFLDYIERY